MGAVFRLAVVVGLAVALAACGQRARVDPQLGVKPSPRVVADGRPIPRGGGREMVGQPYTIGGRTFVPRRDPSYSSVGIASWYGDAFHGRLTANGEVFDRTALSAAHPTMPLPSYARVTNLENGRSIVLRVNDRGPFVGQGRTIDVSRGAAETLAFRRDGLARVRVDYVGPARLEGSDDRVLLASLRTDGGPAMVASAPSAAPAPGAGTRTAFSSTPATRDRESSRAGPSAPAPQAPRLAAWSGPTPSNAVSPPEPSRRPPTTSLVGIFFAPPSLPDARLGQPFAGLREASPRSLRRAQD